MVQHLNSFNCRSVIAGSFALSLYMKLRGMECFAFVPNDMDVYVCNDDAKKIEDCYANDDVFFISLKWRSRAYAASFFSIVCQTVLENNKLQEHASSFRWHKFVHCRMCTLQIADKLSSPAHKSDIPMHCNL
jgi:hypothetical protein